MFTALGDFSFGRSHDRLPEWDEETDEGYIVIGLLFQLVFFILTVVVLMNLLIAMMSQTVHPRPSGHSPSSSPAYVSLGGHACLLIF
jgi:hypothetical protein